MGATGSLPARALDQQTLADKPPVPPTTAPETASSDADTDDDLPRPGKVWEAPKGPSLAEMMRQQSAALAKPPPAQPKEETASDPSNIETVDPADLPAVWRKLLEVVASRGAALHALLSPGQLSAINDGQAIVRYAPKDGTFVRMLDRNGKKDLVRDTLTQLLHQPIGVKFEIDPALEIETATATFIEPAPSRLPVPQTVRREIPQQPPAPAPDAIRLTPELREQLRNDPWVKAVLEEFGGDIVKVE